MGDYDSQNYQFKDLNIQRKYETIVQICITVVLICCRKHKKDAASSYQLNKLLYDQGSVNERLAQGLTTSKKEHKKKLKEKMENLQRRIDGGDS